MIPATPENIERARDFLLEKWQERAVRKGRPAPADLRMGCKFAALFAQGVFGGEIRGNWHHTWVEVDGEALDLTDEAGLNAPVHPMFKIRYGEWSEARYQHDETLFNHKDHRTSLESCETQVKIWLSQFGQRVPSPVGGVRR